MTEILAVIVGALAVSVTSWIERRSRVARERHRTVEQLLKETATAVRLAQLARSYPGNAGDAVLADLDPDAAKAVTIALRREGVERFIRRNIEAKEALARSVQEVPELAEYLRNGWEIRPDEADAILDLLHRKGGVQGEIAAGGDSRA